MVLLFPPISKSQYRVDVGVRQCQRIFATSGIHRSALSPYPSKDMKIQKNGKPLQKKRTEIEQDDSLILVYQDEVHFQYKQLLQQPGIRGKCAYCKVFFRTI